MSEMPSSHGIGHTLRALFSRAKTDPPAPYPFPELLSLVPLDLTPADYQDLSAGQSLLQLLQYPDQYPAYWAGLPRYTYAHCPFCRHTFQAPADPYAVSGWQNAFLILHQALFSLPKKRFVAPSCPHLLGIHPFLNLHNQLPTEVTRLDNATAEVPYLTPAFFPADIPGAAVLFALPICRVEDGRFVPRYTTFALTYFSQSPYDVKQREYARQVAWAAGDNEFYAGLLGEPGRDDKAQYREELYDLAAWAARGQLGWIDWTTPGSPLRLSQDLKLPPIYIHIQGIRHTYTWFRGDAHLG